jgi:hypothetical protein
MRSLESLYTITPAESFRIKENICSPGRPPSPQRLLYQQHCKSNQSRQSKSNTNHPEALNSRYDMYVSRIITNNSAEFVIRFFADHDPRKNGLRILTQIPTIRPYKQSEQITSSNQSSQRPRHYQSHPPWCPSHSQSPSPHQTHAPPREPTRKPQTRKQSSSQPIPCQT